MNNIKKFFLRIIYRLLIFRIIVIDKKNFNHYNKLNTFCELDLNSNMGPIKFLFKEDRRRRKRHFDNLFLLNNFLVELKVPENLVLKRQEINDKVIIVIKIILFKIDYNVLAEVLLDIYLNSIIKYIKDHDSYGSPIIVK